MTTPGVASGLREYLIPPAEGFSAALDAASTQQLTQGYRAVVGGDISAARQVASILLGRDPDMAPAQVLAAQADLVEARAMQASQRLQPIASRYPTYVAAEVTLGRAEEDLGNLVRAFSAYRQVADTSDLAARRSQELLPRVTEVVAQRAEEAASRGRLQEAEEQLDLLNQWSPDSEVTERTALVVYQANGDREKQLQAVSGLLRLHPDDVALLERSGDLQLATGDANSAIVTFQKLLQTYPRNPDLADKLDRAKFSWRLQNLPEEVQQAAKQTELTRADYAVLLYWLVPGVRAAVGATPKIATDILDHPERQVLMRIVNLRLMEVDASLRRFRPDEPVTRVEALSALLRVLKRFHGASCVSELEEGDLPVQRVCGVAARCSLLAAASDCLPQAHVSGAEALEWLRQVTEY